MPETNKPKGMLTILIIATLLAMLTAYHARVDQKATFNENVELTKQNLALTTRLENCRATTKLYQDSLSHTINHKVKRAFDKPFWQSRKDTLR
jgi:hypothetical protein